VLALLKALKRNMLLSPVTTAIVCPSADQHKPLVKMGLASFHLRTGVASDWKLTGPFWK
jgi:hypothetical protein